MLEPLVKTIEVPCNQKKAFTVFMDMGSWWPKDKFATSVMRGQTVKALRVDARGAARSSRSPPTATSSCGARSRPTTPTAT